MKKTLLFLCSCCLALAANAVPARPGTFTVTQPDGTVLTLQLVGDEHFHYYLDVDTGRRLQRNAQGAYVGLSDAEFTRCQALAAQRHALAAATRQARLEHWVGRPTDLDRTYTDGPRKAVGVFNGSLTGKRKGLVILVNFADLNHCIDSPQQEWDRAFNEEGFSDYGHNGSVHDYFYDQSYGQFDLTFDVVGPVTVSRNMSYYGKNNTYGSDAHPEEMVVEACRLVDSQVNFADYDWDGDGEVDQVYVIYAGQGEASGGAPDTIWPHEYWLEYGYGSKLRLDGVYLNTYACSCELRGSGALPTMNGIGTACHEFSHCIGFPDFYDVNYSGSFGMNAWDVLDNGSYNGPAGCGEVPAGYTAYERWMAGWLEPIEISEGCEITAMPSISEQPVAYILRNKNKGTVGKPVQEYFLLENRQGKRWFNYPAQSHGLLVTHVDYNKQAWTQNMVNVTSSFQRMAIIPASKSFGTFYEQYKQWQVSSKDYRGMLFPGAKKVTELTDESHYDCGAKLHNLNSDKTYRMGLPLTEITESLDGHISFLVLGGPDNGNRWTVTFDAGGGTTPMPSWQQTNNRERITLPEAQAPIEGWRFMGWTTTDIPAPTTTRPHFLAAGTEFQPEADVTFYAVYAINSDGQPLVDEFWLSDNLVSGRDYLIVSKDAEYSGDIIAISASNLLLNSMQKNPLGAVVGVDFSGVKPRISAATPDIIWRATCEDELVTFTNGTNYLNVSNGGLGLSDSPIYLYWNNDFGLYGKAPAGNSYYVHNSSGKFSASATRTKTSRVFLYEMSDFSDRLALYATRPVVIEVEGITTPTTATAVSPTLVDLQGRRTSSTAHGVFITTDGRKVIR